MCFQFGKDWFKAEDASGSRSEIRDQINEELKRSNVMTGTKSKPFHVMHSEPLKQKEPHTPDPSEPFHEEQHTEPLEKPHTLVQEQHIEKQHTEPVQRQEEQKARLPVTKTYEKKKCTDSPRNVKGNVSVFLHLKEEKWDFLPDKTKVRKGYEQFKSPHLIPFHDYNKIKKLVDNINLI